MLSVAASRASSLAAGCSDTSSMHRGQHAVRGGLQASEVDTGHGKLIAVTLAGSMFMWVTVLLARCTGAYPCQDASWHEQAVAKPMQQIQVELDTGKKKFGPPNVCPSSLLVK